MKTLTSPSEMSIGDLITYRSQLYLVVGKIKKTYRSQNSKYSLNIVICDPTSGKCKTLGGSHEVISKSPIKDL